MAGRVLFHIDLNCFFASAEILKNTALKGQPLVVAGLSRRSVVCAASYEAREYGINSAMPLHEALNKCNNLIVVQGDYEWYEQLSHKFMQLIRTFSKYVEPASIDECYVDVTETIMTYKRPLDLAWKIQREVFDKLGLPCSIGVGPNKFLAKMASDMRKPMGITVLRKQEIQRKLWPLSIYEMWGIGKKTAPILEKNGIETIGDLANPDNELKIMTLLGKHAYNYIQNARGNDTNRLSFNNTVQSISQSKTLDYDIIEYDEVKTVFKKLAQSLSNRAKAEGISGALVSITIRYNDFTNAVRSMNINMYTNDESILLEHALLLFDRHFNGMPIRHLGIGLGSLFSKTKTITQLSIFEQNDTPSSSIAILAELNKQIPGANLKFASSIEKKHIN